MALNSKKPSSPLKLTKVYPNKGTKYRIIVEHLHEEGSINKYEALLLGESCLSATVCNMCTDFGLKVSRHTEKAKDPSGSYSYATRYMLTKQDIKKLDLIKFGGSNE